MNADELTRLLDELGTRLGPTGEYVFGLAVRQVYINAVTSVVLLGVALAVGALAGPRVLRWVRAGNDGRGYGNDREIVAFILGICWGFGLVLAVLAVVMYVPSVLNPEYAALRSLLGQIQ
jgi:hypothetical protein